MTICFFGASNPALSPSLCSAIERLGALSARRGHALITGGGRLGAMGVVTDGARREGGEVTGIAPQFMVDKGWMHPGLTGLVATSGMTDRKARMAEMADAFVLLPGGYGSLDEFFEVVTLKQLSLLDKPAVIFNTGGYYDHLLAFVEHALRCGGLHGDGKSHGRGDTFAVATTPEQVMQILETADTRQQ